MPVQEMTCRRNDVASHGHAGVGHLGRGLLAHRVRHVEQDHVLAVGQPDAALAAALGDVGQGAQVLAGQAAAQRGAAERVEARLATAGVKPTWSRIGASGGAGGGPSASSRPRRSSSAWRNRSGPHSSTQELRARARALEAVAVVAEQRGDLAGHLDRVLARDPRAEPPAHARRGAEAAADPHVVAGPEVRGVDADQADVVDLVLGAVVAAARDGDLVLARQVREAAVADEVRHELVARRARESKYSSAVTPASGQPTTLRHTSPQAWALVRPTSSRRREDVRHVLQPQPVQLDALPRGDVGERAAVADREVGDRPQLPRVELAVGDPHPQHEVAVLLGLLRVDAPPLRRAPGRPASSAAKPPWRAARTRSSMTSSPSFRSLIRSISGRRSRSSDTRPPPGGVGRNRISQPPVGGCRTWHRSPARATVAEASQGRFPPPLSMRPATGARSVRARRREVGAMSSNKARSCYGHSRISASRHPPTGRRWADAEAASEALGLRDAECRPGRRRRCRRCRSSRSGSWPGTAGGRPRRSRTSAPGRSPS